MNCPSASSCLSHGDIAHIDQRQRSYYRHTVCFYFAPPPARGANYCDQCVCLFARISQRPQCNASCVFGLVDDVYVLFSHLGLHGAWHWQYRRGRRVLQQAVKISNVLTRRRHAVRHVVVYNGIKVRTGDDVCCLVIAVLHLKTEVTAIGGFCV